MKKYKYIIYWILIIAFVIISLGFVADKSSIIHCNKINVEVTDSLTNSFVKNSDIVSLVLKKQPKILGTSFSEINTKLIETEILNHPSVESSEVYKSIDGNLTIQINQRDPVIRIVPKSAKGFYIDRNGRFMPLSDNFSSHVLIANGEIDLILYLNKTPDVKSLKNKTIKDLYNIALYLSDNNFWNSQIEQIYVKQNGEYELVPRVGAQIILLGNADNIEKKLRNLKAVYLEGFNKEGWTKYDYINLKYNNQVICTKR